MPNTQEDPKITLWKQFIEFVADKNQPMSHNDWIVEAVDFAKGDIQVALTLLAMTKKAELLHKMAKNVVAAEA